MQRESTALAAQRSALERTLLSTLSDAQLDLYFAIEKLDAEMLIQAQERAQDVMAEACVDLEEMVGGTVVLTAMVGSL